METDTVTLPAHWASALVNGDCSGLDDREASDLCTELDRLAADGWHVVDVVDGEEPRFTWSFRLYGGDCAGGEVVDYVIVKWE